MNRLRELRAKTGKSQTTLANELHFAQNTISQWERGSRDIDNDKLHVLADYFNVTIDYLLGRDEVKPKNEASSKNVPLEKSIMDSHELSDESKQLMLQHLKLVKTLDKARSNNELG